MPPLVSHEVVILTRAELKAREDAAFKRGVERGKFEAHSSPQRESNGQQGHSGNRKHGSSITGCCGSPRQSPVVGVAPMSRPDLSMFSVRELMDMMRETMGSDDPSDRQFCKECRDEIAKRKPEDAPRA